MSKSNAAETDLLKLLFTAVAWANLADNTVTSPCTSLTFALHTADPGDSGDQTTSEATYNGYARVPVTRSAVWFAVASGSCSPIFPINFPEATGGSNVITYASIGTGVGNYMIYSGPVSPSVSVVNGVVVRLTASSVITED